MDTTEAFPDSDSRRSRDNEPTSVLPSTRTSSIIHPQRRPSISEIIPRIYGSSMKSIDIVKRIWSSENLSRYTALEYVLSGVLGPADTTIEDQFWQPTQRSHGPEERDSDGGVPVNDDQRPSRSAGENLLAVNPGAHHTHKRQLSHASNRKRVFTTITVPALLIGAQRRHRRHMLTRASTTLTPTTSAAPEKGRPLYCGSRVQALINADRDEGRSEQPATPKGPVDSSAVLNSTQLQSTDNSKSLPAPVALRPRQPPGGSYRQLISAQLEPSSAADHPASRRTQLGNGSFPIPGAKPLRVRSEARSMVPAGSRTVESLVPNAWAPVVSVNRVPITGLSTAVYNTIPRERPAATTSPWGNPNAFGHQVPGVDPNVQIPGAARPGPPAHATLPYQPLSYAMFPCVTYPSPKCKTLLPHDVLPSYDAAMKEEYLPFSEAGRSATPAQWGVVKISEVSNSLFIFLQSLSRLQSLRSLTSLSIGPPKLLVSIGSKHTLTIPRPRTMSQSRKSAIMWVKMPRF